jgi:hypothetical protein
MTDVTQDGDQDSDGGMDITSTPGPGRPAGRTPGGTSQASDQRGRPELITQLRGSIPPPPGGGLWNRRHHGALHAGSYC